MNNMFQNFMSQMFNNTQGFPFGFSQPNFQNPFGFNNFNMFSGFGNNPFMGQMNFESNAYEKMKEANQKMAEEQKKFFEEFYKEFPNLFKNEKGEIRPINEQVMNMYNLFSQLSYMEYQKKCFEQYIEVYKAMLLDQYNLFLKFAPNMAEKADVFKTKFEDLNKVFEENIYKNMDNAQAYFVNAQNQFNEQMKQAYANMAPLFNKMNNPFKNMMGSGNTSPFGIPVSLLQFLMQLEASPEKLNMLQKFLDFIFAQYEKQTTNQNPEEK